MRKSKKVVALLLSFVMCMGAILSGCGQGQEKNSSENENTEDTKKEETDTKKEEADAPKSDVTLEIAVGWTAEPLAGFEAMLDKYTAETGVKFEVVAPGEDYENQMKIRMASNDLPDLWITHGWSIMRYSEYLTDLSGESWAGDVSEAAKGIVQTEDGAMYVLPISIALSAMCYNQDALEKAGVDWKTIKTMDDLDVACEKLVAAGVSPFLVGGKDNGNIGAQLNALLFQNFANPTSPTHDALTSFQDGSLDVAATWDPVIDTILEWRDKGYFNEDYMTLASADSQKLLGEGAGAFYIRNTQMITQALSYVPDANLGLMPMPALEPGGQLSVTVSEGQSCFGIWKDTEYMEEAKALLNWMAQPEIATQFLEFDGAVAGLKSTPDNSLIKQCYDEIIEAYGAENVYFGPTFDTRNLPSGMWSVLCEAAGMLLNDSDRADIYEYLQENYDILYAEGNAK